jgi:hypothetical protein
MDLRHGAFGCRSQGEVVEWLMAPVLKTGEVKASVGSNPTLSVSELKTATPAGLSGAAQAGSEPKERRMSLGSSRRCKASVGELVNSGIRCS